MSEGGEGRTEITCFEVVPKTSKRWIFMDILRKQVPGSGSRNAKSTQAEWKIWRGTVSSLAEEERMVRRGLQLWRRLARYGGRPEPSAFKVIVDSLKLIQESIGSQWSSEVVDLKENEFWGTVILARAFCTRCRK